MRIFVGNFLLRSNYICMPKRELLLHFLSTILGTTYLERIDECLVDDVV